MYETSICNPTSHMCDMLDEIPQPTPPLMVPTPKEFPVMSALF